ncbi:MAG: NuoM family protein, partial [Phycisphaerae bacterium]
LAGAGLVCLLPGAAARAIRATALSVAALSLVTVAVAVGLFIQAGPGGDFALEKDIAWIGGPGSELAVIDIRYHVGLDGLSVWLLALTGLLTPLSVWASFSGIRHRLKEYYALLLVLQTGMLGVFCAMDLLLFYIFFEFTLVPLFLIIGIWGGPERRRAAEKFFIYTIAGSVLTFAGILYLAWVGYQHSWPHRFSFDLRRLYSLAADGLLPTRVQWWLFLAFWAGFAIKVPLFPLHTWLPLAHTEAPTAGSVILAGVLLKLGTYGFLRFSLPMLPEAAVAFAPFMAVLAIAGIIYGALCAWVQRDIKKLVAYSSVSHLGFCMLGMFSLKTAGLTGSLLYMVNHGLATGALFLVVGMIYERYHTRNIDQIGGLARRMPVMAFGLMIFVLASIALPGLNGFVSEFLVLLGTFTSAEPATLAGRSVTGPLGISYAVVAATGIILSAIYLLWMCRCVLFGPIKEPPHTPDISGGLRADLTGREIGVLAPIAALCILLGVFPKPLLQTIEPAVQQQVLVRVYAARAEPQAIQSPGDVVRAPPATPMQAHQADHSRGDRAVADSGSAMAELRQASVARRSSRAIP